MRQNGDRNATEIRQNATEMAIMYHYEHAVNEEEIVRK